MEGKGPLSFVYCHIVVQLYESTTKSEIRQGCIKAAERWIYQIIGFSRLNKQNRVTKIDKTRFFVILEITFLWVFQKRPFKYCQVAALLANYLDRRIRSFDGSFSYCLKRQMGELVPFSPKIDVGNSKNYEHLCGVWFLKVLFMIKITCEKLMSCTMVAVH